MSIDTVLAYDSMAGVRARLAHLQATELLRHVYASYHGHWLPKKREEQLSLRIAGYPHYAWDVAQGQEVEAYVKGLCHVIWVEEHVRPPWSLKSYTSRQLQFLVDRTVDMDTWGPHGTGRTGCWGHLNARSSVPREPMAEEWYKAFPLSFYLVGRDADPSTAAVRLLSWVMANFYHPYQGGHDFPQYVPYQQRDSGWRTWLDEYFHERAVGCHGAAKLLTALLRSINIPALEIHHGGHGICYLPTLERYVHGDLIANLALLKDNSTLLMTLSELAPYLPSPRDWENHRRYGTDVRDHEDYIGEAQDQDPLAGVRLRRRGCDLFLGPVNSASDDPVELPPIPLAPGSDEYAALRARLPQFGVHQVGAGCKSQRVRIRELYELPQCGLALDVGKDADGWVEVRLENRGYTLNSSAGELGVEVDGLTRAALRLRDTGPTYIDGGGRSVIKIGYQIGADEKGVVRVRLQGLPAPCPSMEVMRHLGKPLVVDPPGPIDPIIFDPIR